MAEMYVKVDDFIEYCDTNSACLQGQSVAQAALRRVKEFVKENAAEAQPVEHSRWIPMGDGTYNAFCENCGMERGSKAWNKDDFKYCFCCGAKMDKE